MKDWREQGPYTPDWKGMYILSIFTFTPLLYALQYAQVDIS